MLSFRRRKLILASLACSCLIPRLPLRADDSFIGLPSGGTGSWSDPANWSSGNLPGSLDLASIPNSDAFDRTVSLDVSTSVATLILGNDGGGVTTLIQNDGVNLSASSESLGILITGPDLTDLHSASATQVQNGGTTNIGTLAIGGYATVFDAFPSSSATYILNDGTLTTSNYLNVGHSGMGTFVQNGGYVDAPLLVVGFLYYGSTGTYMMNGGTLSAGNLIVGNDGTALFTQSGGTISVSNTLSVGSDDYGPGTFIMNSANDQLTANMEVIGGRTTGTFIQSAGMNQTTSLIVSDLVFPAVYELSGGSLSVTKTMYIGTSNGIATLDMTGGLLSVGTLLVGGRGTFTVTRGALSISTLTVSGQMTLASGLGDVLDLKGLSVASHANLDIADNPLIYDYTNPIVNPFTHETQADVMRQYLQEGALTSSLNDEHHRLGYADNQVLGLSSFAGQSVDATSMLVKFTYAGDANLDGKVDINDLELLAQHWDTSGQYWTGGDFNYDGVVDVADLYLLAQNWQAGVGDPSDQMAFDDALTQAGLSIADVPEPSIFAGLCVIGLLSRRRLRRS